MEHLERGDPARVGGFELLARLGRGGMGSVYLGFRSHERLAAVKVVHEVLAADEDFRRRFAREVTAARRVSGHFTAAVVDADPEAERPWMATRFIDGPSLSRAVEPPGRPLPASDVMALARAVAQALAAMHAVGVVHLDLKPSNVILAEDGPRVIDFGISHLSDGTQITRPGYLIGTLAYLSPEQAGGGADVGPPSDIFSLGGLLYYAATGKAPFGVGDPGVLHRILHSEPNLEALPDLSLQRLVLACLKKEPSARCSLEQLIQDLIVGPSFAEDVTERVNTDVGQRSPWRITEVLQPPSPTLHESRANPNSAARHCAPVRLVSFTGDGAHLHSVDEDGLEIVWRIGSGELQPSVTRVHGPLSARPIAATSADGRLAAWVDGTNIQVGRLNRSHYPWPLGVSAWSPDKPDWVSAPGAVQLTPPRLRPESLTFSPTGRWLAVTRADGVCVCEDMRAYSGDDIQCVGPIGGRVVAFLGNGRLMTFILPNSDGAWLEIIDLTGKGDLPEGRVQARTGHRAPVQAAASSSRSEIFATGAVDGSIVIHRPLDRTSFNSSELMIMARRSPEELLVSARYERNERDSVRSMGISPDQTLLAVGTDDGTLRVLDLTDAAVWNSL